MNIMRLGNNLIELHYPKYTVLVNQETPVAVYEPGKGYMKTNSPQSNIAKENIKKWVGRNTVTIIDQSSLDKFLK